MTAADPAIAWATATAALITEQTGNVAEVHSQNYGSERDGVYGGELRVWITVHDLSGLPSWTVSPGTGLGVLMRDIQAANAYDRRRHVQPPSHEQAAHDAARTAELNDWQAAEYDPSTWGMR